MEPDTLVWLRDTVGDEAWLAGKIVSRFEFGATRDSLGFQDFSVLLENGETRQVTLFEQDNLELRSAKDSALVEDLIELTFLHEPAILHTLRQRFKAGQIYTFTGPVLLAVNPFRQLPLYDDETLGTYYNAGLLRSQGMTDLTEKMSPHVFAVADNAYRAMMDVILDKVLSAKMNQAVLISGESGAGKTESTKFVMRYLTVVGNTKGSSDFKVGSVTDRVLKSNPILEAFGNAGTARNSNSSRFGKYIELLFDSGGSLCGAKIETYLLEKARLTSQNPGERCFHMLYQLTCQRSGRVFEKFGVSAKTLALRPPEQFRYINQGGIFQINGVDDFEGLRETQIAMDVLDFSKQEQTELLHLVAGVLQLGEISFRDTFSNGVEACDIADASEAHEAMSTACRLLGVAHNVLWDTLTLRQIHVHGEMVATPKTASQAVDACASLAKAIYVKLFAWVVAKINRSIALEQTKDAFASIGVLDIFGFESFETNSFEQLCINFANETLQQHFNQFIFKLEQEEYEREGIEWSFITFPDNQQCLALIRGRPNGIFAQLEDETILGSRGNDNSFVTRMYQKKDAKQASYDKLFAANGRQRRDLKFSLTHYAGAVVYDAHGFVLKNKDELPNEAVAIFTSSSHKTLRDAHALTEAGAAEPNASDRRSSSRSRRARAPKSISAQFSGQLRALMTKLEECAPHFIRCIKPNERFSAAAFEKPKVVNQLRYSGVLEAVRLARSGFQVRYPHADFYEHYRVLLVGSPGAIGMPWEASDRMAQARDQCSLLIDSVYEDMCAERDSYDARVRGAPGDAPTSHRRNSSTGHWRRGSSSGGMLGLMPVFKFERREVQLGHTKVFMRRGAYDILESARTKLVAKVRLLQAMIRGWRQKRMYQAMKTIARATQSFVRRMQLREMIREARRLPSVLRLQAFTRGVVARKRYLRLLSAVKALQRKQRQIIQKRVAEQHLKFEKAVVTLQGRVRKMISRRTFELLREEADRDVDVDESDRRSIEILQLQVQAARSSSERRIREHEEGAQISRQVLERQMAIIRQWKEKFEKAESDKKKLARALDEMRQRLESEERRPPSSRLRGTARGRSAVRTPRGERSQSLPPQAEEAREEQVPASVRGRSMSPSGRYSRSFLQPVDAPPLSLTEDTDADSATVSSTGAQEAKSGEGGANLGGTQFAMPSLKPHPAWAWFEQFIVSSRLVLHLFSSAFREGVHCTVSLTEEGGVPRLAFQRFSSRRERVLLQAFFSRNIPAIPIVHIQSIAVGHSQLYGMSGSDTNSFVTLTVEGSTGGPQEIVIGFARPGDNQTFLRAVANIVTAASEVQPRRHSTPALEGRGDRSMLADGGLAADRSRARTEADAFSALRMAPSDEFKDEVSDYGPLPSIAEEDSILSDADAPGAYQQHHLMREIYRVRQYAEALERERAALQSKIIQQDETMLDNNDRLREVRCQSRRKEERQQEENEQLSAEIQELRKQLETKEKTVKNNTRVRMRLGKRIEELESEKAEYKRQMTRFARENQQLLRDATG